MNVFRHKENPAVAANQLIFGPVGLGFDQRKIRASVGRRNFNPTDAGRKRLFGDELEAEPVDVEPLAYFHIADENDDVLDAQVGLFASGAKHSPVRP